MPVAPPLEFISDNGEAKIGADTGPSVRALGLEPIKKTVCSPQSNGMTESFANAFESD